jgi:hypothetical protein
MKYNGLMRKVTVPRCNGKRDNNFYDIVSFIIFYSHEPLLPHRRCSNVVIRNLCPNDVVTSSLEASLKIWIKISSFIISRHVLSRPACTLYNSPENLRPSIHPFSVYSLSFSFSFFHHIHLIHSLRIYLSVALQFRFTWDNFFISRGLGARAHIHSSCRRYHRSTTIDHNDLSHLSVTFRLCVPYLNVSFVLRCGR